MYLTQINGVSFDGRFKVPARAMKKGESELALLFSNDSHSKIGKLPNLKTARDEFVSDFKKSDAVAEVATTGDNFLSKPSKKNMAWLNFLNNFLKPKFQTIGNHELDISFDYAGENIKNLNATSLIANMFSKDNKFFAELRKSGKIANSLIVEKNGQKFGFIGVTTDEVKQYKSFEELQGVDILNIDKTKEVIQKEVRKLNKNGIKNIVLLSHLGYVPDMLIAGAYEGVKSAKELEKLKLDLHTPDLKSTKGVDGIGLIVGGHTHTELKGVIDIEKARRILKNKVSSDFDILNPEEKNRIVNFITPKSGKPVLITQAGAENKYVGFIDVIFDKNGVIKKDSIINKIMKVDSFKPDKKVSKALSDILGEREELFKLKKPFIDPQRRSENAIQNMMADAIVHYANKELPNVDFSLIHGAVIRGDVEGNVSNWDLEHDLTAFSEYLYMINLSEKDIVDLVNNTAIRTLVSNTKPVLIHPSKELRYTISKTPEILEDGTKLYVKEIRLTDRNGKTRILNLKNPSNEKKYNVVTEEYFLHGNPETGGKEGFSSMGVKGFTEYFKGLAPKPDDVIKHYDFTDKGALIKYMQENYKGKEVEFLPDGRITILKEDGFVDKFDEIA